MFPARCVSMGLLAPNERSFHHDVRHALVVQRTFARRDVAVLFVERAGRRSERGASRYARRALSPHVPPRAGSCCPDPVPRKAGSTAMRPICRSSPSPNTRQVPAATPSEYATMCVAASSVASNSSLKPCSSMNTLRRMSAAGAGSEELTEKVTSMYVLSSANVMSRAL